MKRRRTSCSWPCGWSPRTSASSWGWPRSASSSSSTGAASSRSLRDILREGFRRNAIDAAHFLGLAHLYAEKGENARAIECIEVAKAKDLANPANHKLHGRLLFRRRDFDGAAEEFGRALRYNPFDRETAESLGRAEYERKQFEAGPRGHRARLPAAQRRRRGRGAAAAAAHPDPEADPRLGEPRARRRSSASARSWCTPPSTGWSGTASASSSRAGCPGANISLTPPPPPQAAETPAASSSWPRGCGGSSRSPTSPTSRSSASPRPSTRRSTTSAA